MRSGTETATAGRVQTLPASERNDAFVDAVNRLKDLCHDDLERLTAEILENLSSSVPMIPDVAGHLITAGGKRLRPLLTLATARALGCDGHSPIMLASAVELIHGATLLHDDVVDGSRLRRGRSTANVIWGDKESVLVGDFLFSRAFELMVAVGDIRILNVLSRASGVIAEGEVMQLTTQKNIDATFDMYLSVVDAKTAALFAAAAQAGAIVAGAAPSVEDGFHAYGRNLGIAFQLVDDALDYAGRQSSLGKSVGDDFREAKMTSPVVYALSRATAAERDFWRRTFAEGDQTDGDFDEALRIMDRTGAIDRTFACAREYALKALDNLAAAPANGYTRALADLATQSVARAF